MGFSRVVYDMNECKCVCFVVSEGLVEFVLLCGKTVFYRGRLETRFKPVSNGFEFSDVFILFQ